MLFVASFVMMICTKNSEKTGIIPYKMGIDESAIGMHTRSLATKRYRKFEGLQLSQLSFAHKPHGDEQNEV